MKNIIFPMVIGGGIGYILAKQKCQINKLEEKIKDMSNTKSSTVNAFTSSDSNRYLTWEQGRILFDQMFNFET